MTLEPWVITLLGVGGYLIILSGWVLLAKCCTCIEQHVEQPSDQEVAILAAARRSLRDSFTVIESIIRIPPQARVHGSPPEHHEYDLERGYGLVMVGDSAWCVAAWRSTFAG